MSVLVIDPEALRAWKNANPGEAKRIKGRFRVNFDRESRGEITLPTRITENGDIFREEVEKGTPIEILKGLADEAQQESSAQD